MECEQWFTEHGSTIQTPRRRRCGTAGKRARPFTRLPGYLIGIIRRFGASWRRLAGYAHPSVVVHVLALTLAEREEISRGIARDLSLRTIAARLGRAPSTISREVNRNGGLNRYRAGRTDQAAWDRAHRPTPCKLVINRALARLVAKKLRALWSPEQIAGWLKCTYANDESYQVSHATIYRSLFIQARGH
jgi:AraC-like DNA-binding protein